MSLLDTFGFRKEFDAGASITGDGDDPHRPLAGSFSVSWSAYSIRNSSAYLPVYGPPDRLADLADDTHVLVSDDDVRLGGCPPLVRLPVRPTDARRRDVDDHVVWMLLAAPVNMWRNKYR